MTWFDNLICNTTFEFLLNKNEFEKWLKSLSGEDLKKLYTYHTNQEVFRLFMHYVKPSQDYFKKNKS
jgi:hypothetical protein